MFILVGSTVFSLVFRGMDGDLWVEHLLTGVPGGALGFLIVVNVMIFLLAFFLDYFEIAFIMVPLLAPVAQKLGIDLVWFGVLLAVNMQTSFLHPPFGFALFYLRSVAPKSVRDVGDLLGRDPVRRHPGDDDRGRHRASRASSPATSPRRPERSRARAPRSCAGRSRDRARRRPLPAAPGTGTSAEPPPKADDAGAELERLLKGQ